MSVTTPQPTAQSAGQPQTPRAHWQHRLAERGELDDLDALEALELGEQRSERMTAVELVGPIGRDDEDRLGPRVPDQEAEQVTRGGIGPVEILQDEHQRPLLGQAVQNVVDSGHVANDKAVQMVNGKGDMVDVVTALSQTELAMDTMVAVRDRVISAYEEIMRMPI